MGWDVFGNTMTEETHEIILDTTAPTFDFQNNS